MSDIPCQNSPVAGRWQTEPPPQEAGWAVGVAERSKREAANRFQTCTRSNLAAGLCGVCRLQSRDGKQGKSAWGTVFLLVG